MSAPVAALAEELRIFADLQAADANFLRLMRRLAFLSSIKNLKKNPAMAIIKAGYYPWPPCPSSVAAAIAGCTDEPVKKGMMEYFLQRRDNFEKKHLVAIVFMKSFNCSPWRRLKAGQSRGRIRWIAGNPRLFYTTGRIRLHLEKHLQLLQRYDNFQFTINKESRHLRIPALCKRRTGGLIIIKQPLPYIIFAINESN
jgi:hypothetical protein